MMESFSPVDLTRALMPGSELSLTPIVTTKSIIIIILAILLAFVIAGILFYNAYQKSLQSRPMEPAFR